MSDPDVEFSFVPKSTVRLERGHFWAIPLRDQRFGAGCVVGRMLDGRKPASRVFIAGVVAWHGASPPRSQDLFDREVVACAFAHIKTITVSGGVILGKAQLQFRDLPSEAQALAMSTWGYSVATLLAQKYAAEHA